MKTASNSFSTRQSFSKQDSTLLPNPTPPRISFKYLARTLYLHDNDDIMKLKIIHVKRFHIQKLAEENESRSDRRAGKQFPKNIKTLLKKKLFKGLTSLKMSSFSQLYWLEEFKSLKSLVQFRSFPGLFEEPQDVTIYLRKLNKNLEKISFYNDWLDDARKLKKVSRALGKLHNLKSHQGFKRFHGMETNQPYYEFLDLNKYFEKLPRLESFECHILDPCLNGVRDLMYGDSVYKKVTRLSINFEYLKSEEEAEEEIENEDEENKEILPFFQFQAFPNLIELHIQDRENYCSYGSFVVEGFKKLGFLKKLSLELTPSPGIHFIFEGLLHLPKLLSFSLDIPYEIKPLLWTHLALFLKEQENVIVLEFSVNPNRENGLEALENFLASLSHKPKLQHLTLRVNYFPLHIIPRGLKQLIGSDQLKSLRIETTSRYFIFAPAVSESVDDLYDFLLRNKNTLSELKLDLPLFKLNLLNDAFANVLSQLTELKTLSLDISVESILMWESQRLHFINKVDEEEDNQDSWNLSLNDILPKLERIQDLTLSFTGLEKCPSKYRKFMINCFRVLPSLKNLRRLAFSLPKTGLSSTEFGSINVVLGELKSLLSIQLLNTDIEDDNLRLIEAKVKELQESQSLQMSLSF